jgi:hypothetical protein
VLFRKLSQWIGIKIHGNAETGFHILKALSRMVVLDDDLLSGEEDDEIFVLESSRLLGENDSIASLLKRLQKPWINPRAPLPETHYEGWLWKKKRRTTGWSRVYCLLDGYQFTWKKDPSVRFFYFHL